MIKLFLFDNFPDFPSVEVSLHSRLMENKIKSAGKSIAVLGSLASAVAQGGDLEQLQNQLAQQLSQAPEAVTKVLQSGEGCDISILNQAVETDNYDTYLVCGEIEVLKAQIHSAKLEQALEERQATKAELTQEQESKLVRREQDKTTIDVLTKRGQELDASIAQNEAALLAALLEK